MRLLYVDTSPKGARSNSRALGRFLVDALGEISACEVDYLDLAAQPLPHVDEVYCRAIYTEPAQRSPAMQDRLRQSDDLCRRVLAADVLVCAIPMHNWCYPSVFKAFIDHITRIGLTVNYTNQGEVVGQLGRPECVVITTRGSDLGPGSPYAQMDALTPALKAAFGFIGVEDMTFVDVQPLQFANREAHDQAVVRAKVQLQQLADRIAQ